MNSTENNSMLKIFIAVRNRLLKDEGIPIIRNYFILLFIVGIIGIACGCFLSDKIGTKDSKVTENQGIEAEKNYDSQSEDMDDSIEDDNIADDAFTDDIFE